MASPTIVDMLSGTPAMAGKKIKWMDKGRLTADARQRMPKSEFALPGKGDGPKGAGAGSYPIPDKSHARNALARVSQHGSSAEKEKVRAAVHRKFPSIDESPKKKSKMYEHSRSKMED